MMSTPDLDRSAAAAETRPIKILLNVGDPRELNHLRPDGCDGVGLLRTEFLFAAGTALPDEDTQYAAYRRILDWAEGRPVRVRTFDFGGDKSHPALGAEKNPFLGTRGIRWSLRAPDAFRVQLRALARAAAHGPLEVIFPMITQPQEFETACRLLEDSVLELVQHGVAARVPATGIMVEVPAVALCPELFPGAAFLSVGTNDLVQYLHAAARDEPAVASLYDPAHPAVEKILAALARHGRARRIEVCVCGDLAGDPNFLPMLLRAGIESLSIAPNALASIKAAIATHRV